LNAAPQRVGTGGSAEGERRGRIRSDRDLPRRRQRSSRWRRSSSPPSSGRAAYNKAKLEAYECGVPPSGEARARYPVRFYILAVLFVVFDVETIFLFPWAVKYRVLGLFRLRGDAGLPGILVIGYAYAWRKGALEWA